VQRASIQIWPSDFPSHASFRNEVVLVRTICLAAPVILVITGCAANGDGVPFPLANITAGELRVAVPLTSWKDLKNRGVILQGYDYSCGASALATLMTRHLGTPATEVELLNDLGESLTPVELLDRQENGLSMGDLLRLADRRGFETRAFKLDAVTSLRAFNIPLIVHLDYEGYRHFVVLEAIRGDRIFLADPRRGNVRLSVHKFAKQWTGYVLGVRKAANAESAQRGQNSIWDMQSAEAIELVHARRAVPRLP